VSVGGRARAGRLWLHPDRVLTPLLAIAVLALCLAALAGWGGLMHRLCGGGERVPWTYRAALGLPTVALLGGLLNLVKFAHGPALDALVAAGLLLLAVPNLAWLRDRRMGAGAPAPGWRERLPDLLPRWVIGAAALFFVVTLMPTGIFNHHDDMQKYMVPPLRMLATGTLGGNPFETTGFYSLGFQSFFQAFGVAHFPLVYLNGFDAILCFLLTGLLLDDLGRRGGVAPVHRTLGALILVVINPQYVNISSVFSGSLAVAGLAWSGILLGERIGAAPAVAVARAAVPVGLFAVLLMGLKLTHLPFAALYLLVLLALLPNLAGGWRPVAPAVGGFLAGAAALGAPWLALYENTPLGPLLANALGFARRSIQEAPVSLPPVPDDLGDFGNLGAPGGGGGGGAPAIDAHSIAEVFSTTRIYFGQTALAYGLVTLAAGAVCVAAIAWLVRHRRDGDRAVRAQLAVTVAAGAALLLYYLASPYVYSTQQAIRYVAPLLIPTAVLAVLAAARLGPVPDAARTATRGLAAAACMGLVVGLFVRAAVDRAGEAVLVRSPVSFPLGSFNLRYHRYAFSAETRDVVRAAQARIPEGAPILAWMGTPFHLDYRRNPVYTIPDPDFSRRWLGMPIGDDPADPARLVRFLHGRGVRYMIWAYNVPGMRSDASLQQDIAGGWYAWRGVLTLEFKGMLRTLAHAGEVVYDDGHVVAFALEVPEAEAEPPPAPAP